MRVAKIADIQLVLNKWFIVLIVLFAFAGMSSKVLLVFSAVLWHELAHAGAAIALGFRVREVELLPFGGVARIEGLGSAGSIGEIMIAAAGPVASLVMAAFIYVCMFNASMWADVWEFYFKTNIMLAVFNLIPGLPLDGGRILRAWLALSIDYSKATFIAASISKVLSVGLVVIAVYEYMLSSTVNLTFLVAAVFLCTAAKSEIKVASFRTFRVLAQKKAELTTRGLMPTTHFTVVSSIMLKDIVKRFRPDQYYVVLILNEEFKLCGTLTETEIWEGLPHRGFYARIGEFI